MGIDTLVVAVPVPVRPNGELVDFPDAVARAELVGRAERLPDQVLQVCHRVCFLEDGPDVADDWTQVRELLADGIARIDDGDLALEVEVDGRRWYLLVDQDAGGDIFEIFDPMTALALSGITIKPLGKGRQSRAKAAVAPDHVPSEALSTALGMVRRALLWALDDVPARDAAKATAIVRTFDEAAQGWAGSVEAAQLRVRSAWSDMGYVAFESTE